MEVDSYCLPGHRYHDRRQPPVCFYNADGDWFSLSGSNYLTQSLHDIRFTHDKLGKPIPLSQQVVATNNITRVVVPPNLSTTLYRSEKENYTIVGTYLENIDGFVSDGGYDFVSPIQVNMVRVSNPYNLSWDMFINGCKDGSINRDCQDYKLEAINQPIIKSISSKPSLSNGGNDNTKPSSNTSSTQMIWIQIVGMIFVIIAIVFVIIAFYKAWKVNRELKLKQMRGSEESISPSMSPEYTSFHIPEPAPVIIPSPNPTVTRPSHPLPPRITPAGDIILSDGRIIPKPPSTKDSYDFIEEF